MTLRSLIYFAAITYGTIISVQAQEWYDKFKIGGDLRLRHEYIDQDNKDETRTRWRYRARIKAGADVTDNFSVGFRLASGGNDPVSTNQSFDGGFTSKGLQFDRAFGKYDAGNGFSVTGGKMSNPMVLVKDLVWDGDLNPEGVNLNFGTDLGGADLDINTGYYFVEERSSADDTTLWGTTATTTFDMGSKVMVGVGYFLYDNIKGEGLLVDDDSFGNTTVSDGDDDVYASDYGIFEVGASTTIDLGFGPLKVYGDYVVNNDAETDEDTGYQFGASIGKAKDPGTWSFDVNYRELEADAVFAAFTDSDFSGGGTGGEGIRLSGKYAVAKNTSLGATYFINSIDPDGDDIDYNRLQVDLALKF